MPYARPSSELAAWASPRGRTGYTLADVVANVQPTIPIGTSTQAGAFSESIVRQMAATVDRPIIMPRPTRPPGRGGFLRTDPLDRRASALVATGSPFAPVEYGGATYRIAQANNALVFPASAWA